MTSLSWPLQGATTPLLFPQIAVVYWAMGTNGDQLYQPMLVGSLARSGLFNPTQLNSSQRIYIPGPRMSKTHGSHEEGTNEQLGVGGGTGEGCGYTCPVIG